jgi:hypothetical protein
LQGLKQAEGSPWAAAIEVIDEENEPTMLPACCIKHLLKILPEPSLLSALLVHTCGDPLQYSAHPKPNHRHAQLAYHRSPNVNQSILDPLLHLLIKPFSRFVKQPKGGELVRLVHPGIEPNGSHHAAYGPGLRQAVLQLLHQRGLACSPRSVDGNDKRRVGRRNHTRKRLYVGASPQLILVSGGVAKDLEWRRARGRELFGDDPRWEATAGLGPDPQIRAFDVAAWAVHMKHPMTQPAPAVPAQLSYDPPHGNPAAERHECLVVPLLTQAIRPGAVLARGRDNRIRYAKAEAPDDAFGPENSRRKLKTSNIGPGNSQYYSGLM